jgi:hypothetical protein
MILRYSYLMKIDSQYTLIEEIFHSITNGISATLAVVGLMVLVVLTAWGDDAWCIVSFLING